MKPKLLVIDDETGVLEMISGHFSLRGFEVYTAGDGGEGIERCAAVHPDVILLDLKMKELDGDKAMPKLRQLAPDATLIVVSACQDEIVQRRIRGLGADTYFEKPVSLTELERFIKHSLKRISPL